MTNTGAPDVLLRPFCVAEDPVCFAVGVWQFSKKKPVRSVAPAGLSVREIIGPTAGCQAFLDGVEIPREAWSLTRVGADQTVHFVAGQHHGNAGKAIRLVAVAVLTYYTMGSGGFTAASFGGNALAATAVNTGLFIAGSMAINALIPPATPAAAQAQDPYSQAYSLTGSSNNASPGGPIPCVIGTTRFFPPHAALPYTELSGNDQYLRMCLDLGYGDLDVSDIRIGDTDLASFDDVEYEITKTPTLFTQDISELALASVLNDAEATDQRTSGTGATELSIDLLFPQGLYATNKKGNTVSAWVYVDVTFRLVGTETWYGTQDSSPKATSTAMTAYRDSLYKVIGRANDQLRVGLRWKVPSAGQYEVQVRRAGTGDWDASIFQSVDMTWTALRSISPQNPSTTGTTKMAVRIKATDQLNGTVSTLSLLAAQKIRTYSNVTKAFGSPIETKNPAWIYLWLLTQCPAVARPLTVNRLDLAAVADWAAECDAKGFTYATMLDSARAFGDLVRDVLSAGRASFGERNGKYAPVRDIAQSTQVQTFTPANSSSFSYTRNFAQAPHALKVKFTNPEADYQEDQVIVYWNGYNAANASRFEELDLRFMDDPAAVWKMARYHLAVAWLRPTTYSLTADFEHIPCERGDLVHVAHDIIGYGTASGRVRAVVGNRVVLDAPPDLDPTKSYRLRVRRASNTEVGMEFQGVATWDSSILRFDMDAGWDEQSPTPVLQVSSSQGIQPGDMYLIGEVNREVLPLIVKSIAPSDDFSATLTLVDAAAGVWTADVGTPPAFISQITSKRWGAAPAPPSLSLRVTVTPPDDAGIVRNQVGVLANSTSSLYRLPTYKQKQLGLI